MWSCDQPAPDSTFSYIFFDTYGLSFGTGGNGGSGVNRPERIIKYFIGIFCILSGILFSGGLLVQFTFTSHIQKYNNIEDLAYENSKLTVNLVSYDSDFVEYLEKLNM